MTLMSLHNRFSPTMQYDELEGKAHSKATVCESVINEHKAGNSLTEISQLGKTILTSL